MRGPTTFAINDSGEIEEVELVYVCLQGDGREVKRVVIVRAEDAGEAAGTVVDKFHDYPVISTTLHGILDRDSGIMLFVDLSNK